MNYYNFLNESFDKVLNEAKQDEINFANVFGNELKDRFKAQKQRMRSPENDFYYWIRLSREDLDGTIEKLDSFLSGLENKQTRSQRSKLASEGAEIVYEDDEWIVLKINTYEAAKKYGAGTVWCITGRYPGHEGRGEMYFNDYRNRNGWNYYFYIKKDGRDLEGRQEKWCLCWSGDLDDDYEVWRGDQEEQDEEQVDWIPGAPQIDGFPDLSVEPEYPEEEDEWPEDAEGERPAPAPREPDPSTLIPVENPNEYEFPASTKEEAARAFKEDGEIVDTINDTLYIVKWHEEPEAAPEEGEGEEGDHAVDTGDRYSLFVFFPGEGGGPLLAQTNDGFALQVFKDLEKARQFAQRMAGGQFADNGIRNNGHDIDAAGMPECLQENFWYYNDKSWYYDL